MYNLFGAAALMGALCASGFPVGAGALESAAGSDRLRGDYVEARTASVFAGACHYNGELTTTGRNAEMVWHFRAGSAEGVDLSGLTVMAAISSNANLRDESAPRRTVLFVDDHATDAQLSALTSTLTKEYKSALGDVVAIKRAPVSFVRSGESFRVDAKGVGRLVVEAMPNRECCKQPNLVWYRPLATIADRRVGFTRESGIEDAKAGISWTKLNQNTAFYGTFSISGER